MLSLPWNKPYRLQWTESDANGNPVNNAAVTATLYSGRSQLHPDRTPGSVVTAFGTNGVAALAYVANSAGVYQAAMPAATSPPPTPSGFYILVFEAKVGSTLIDHDEQPVQVVSS